MNRGIPAALCTTRPWLPEASFYSWDLAASLPALFYFLAQNPAALSATRSQTTDKRSSGYNSDWEVEEFALLRDASSQTDCPAPNGHVDCLTFSPDTAMHISVQFSELRVHCGLLTPGLRFSKYNAATPYGYN